MEVGPPRAGYRISPQTCHPQKPHRALKRVQNASANFRPQELNVVVDQEATKIICLQPVVKMHLVKIGSNDFLSQVMRLAAWERDLQARQHGNQGLSDSVWIAAMRIG